MSKKFSVSSICEAKRCLPTPGQVLRETKVTNSCASKREVSDPFLEVPDLFLPVASMWSHKSSDWVTVNY